MVHCPVMKRDNSEPANAITTLLSHERAPMQDFMSTDVATQSHYRSAILTVNTGINTLVTAAQPVLVLFGRLMINRNIEITKSLQEKLAHEIKAFETRAVVFNYASETILLARYLLCAALDEALQLAGSDAPPLSHADNEKFFEIVKRLSQHAKYQLELLELAYILISLGFEGEYRYDRDGKKMLDILSDDLYRLIRQHHAEKTLHLSTPIETVEKKSYEPFSALLAITLGFSLLTTLYISFNYLLGFSAQPLAEQLHYILQHIQTSVV